MKSVLLFSVQKMDGVDFGCRKLTNNGNGSNSLLSLHKVMTVDRWKAKDARASGCILDSL